MRLTVKEYINQSYAPGSRPTPRTVLRRLRKGQIPHPWTREGKRVYIDVSVIKTGNQLMDRVLNG